MTDLPALVILLAGASLISGSVGYILGRNAGAYEARVTVWNLVHHLWRTIGHDPMQFRERIGYELEMRDYLAKGVWNGWRGVRWPTPGLIIDKRDGSVDVEIK